MCREGQLSLFSVETAGMFGQKSVTFKNKLLMSLGHTAQMQKPWACGSSAGPDGALPP